MICGQAFDMEKLYHEVKADLKMCMNCDKFIVQARVL